jgi:DNA-binding NarL/FixJ family response regulator
LPLEQIDRLVPPDEEEFDPEFAIRVGIIDDRPAVSRGIAISLEAENYLVDEHIDDIDEWFRRAGRKVALLGTRHNVAQMELLSGLRSERYAGLPVIVLLADTSIAVYRRCLLAGAAGMVDQNASLEYICKVVRATVEGCMLLPADVCSAVSVRGECDKPGIQESDHEISWLQALINGSTVSEIAEVEGYSEREMYRLLNSLYARLGADSRTRAIVYAAQRGLVM